MKSLFSIIIAFDLLAAGWFLGTGKPMEACCCVLLAIFFQWERNNEA